MGVSIRPAAQLAEADVQSPGPDYVRNDYFTINGERKRVVFAHPDSRVSYTLALPASPLLAGGACLVLRRSDRAGELGAARQRRPVRHLH